MSARSAVAKLAARDLERVRGAAFRLAGLTDALLSRARLALAPKGERA